MCMSSNGGATQGVARKPRGGLFSAVIKDFAQAKNPTFNPVKRTIDNWSPNAPQQAAPVNPMSVAMAGKAASTASATQPQTRPMSIADSFLGTTAQPAQKPQSGYKVVG